MDMTGKRGRQRGRRRLLRRVTYVLGGVIVAFAALIAVMYMRTRVPPVNAAARAEASIFFYRDGTRLAQVGRLNRVAVPLTAVPPAVRGAVLAAEDRGYYHDPVISPTGLARAVVAAVSGGPRQGGSGIAQQYVKVAYLNPKQTMSRKIKELFIAVKLSRSRSKDWILGQYLNTVYFGRGAYGIQAAAQAYFRKDVGALTPAEGALLAGLIQAPSYLDPALGHTARTQARWRYVIDGMMATGVLPKGPRPAFPKVAPPYSDPLYGGQRGYLIERVMAELRARGYDEDQVYRRGLRVTTTLDPRLQAATAGAVGAAVGRDRDLETGLVSVRPGTGEILAAYGGRDYLKHQYDNAFLAELPTGSSYDPFVLASALEKGIGLFSTFDATPYGTVVNDDGERVNGPVTLLGATVRSYHTVFARLAARAGVAAAGDVGLPRRFPPPRARAVDQAAAYAALADGRYAEPHIIARVTDSSGRPLLDVRPRVHRALPAGVAADVTFALSLHAPPDPRAAGAKDAAAAGSVAAKAVADEGTAARAGGAARPNAVAVKGGTTDHNAAAWYCGYTPGVATAVVMYRASNRPLINEGDAPLARTTVRPAKAWAALMAVAGPGGRFPRPAGVGTTRSYATAAPGPTAPPATSGTPSVPPSVLRKRPSPSGKPSSKAAGDAPDRGHESVPAKVPADPGSRKKPGTG